MKRKMVEVNKCLECPYQSGVDECGYPAVIRDNHKQIPDLDTIPDWCPLQDKGEKDDE